MKPELDLAFSLAESLAPAQRAEAGALADAEAGEACWTALFAAWLAELADDLPEGLRRAAYSLGLELCDDADIAELNASWRGQSGPTDVLAFAALEEAAPLPTALTDPGIRDEPLELGDIVISLETAVRQARDSCQPLPRELLFLASHGLLHLLGWDHPDDASLAAMLERQERLIAAAALDLSGR